MMTSAEQIQNAQQNRDTIFVEASRVISVDEFPGEQFVIRLHAPECAANATAGSFAHIQCDTGIPMRRPLSIMRANAHGGWIEVLFKTIGNGLRALAQKQADDIVSVIGPIGRGFLPSSDRSKPLLIGGGVGIPPMVFLAEVLRDDERRHPLVIMGSEIPFPFATAESTLPAAWLDDSINQTMRLLEEWNIPTRLASLQGYDGCFQGYVTDLAREWLNSLSPDELQEAEIFSCGPTPMLKAVASLAREFDLPCQVSLEEFMACAVGGCAGCCVSVQTEQGKAMKRVCVDGPVFDAAAVFSE
ncbi:MAG: dihydroorotate dehydrogenase electron transfer subunit [Woeseiaceae bacterium]|nr:dihydroorotate dehydrogenase electron transfer subunit [Woeseiaceae bacterium]